jgi:hypothetical protein
MGIIIDGGAAGIDARLAGMDGNKGFKLPGQAVEEAQFGHGVAMLELRE